MSTIVWYDGVMYSDTRLIHVNYSNGEETSRQVKTGEKIFKVGNKIYGVTGTIQGYEDFVRRKYRGSWNWALRPYDFALIIEWDGKNLIGWKLLKRKFWIFHISWFRKTQYNWKDHPELYLTMGSGDDYAIEASDKGLDPVEMIQYASDRDPATNDIIVSMKL